MKHILKGAVVVVGVMIIHMIINIICNVNGVELNGTVMSTMMALVALFLYEGWIKLEKNVED